ncbi:hypothetical protein ACRCPS_31140 [Pseudomonas aeruginosa]
MLEGLALLQMLSEPQAVLPPLTDAEVAKYLASGEFLAAKRFPCGRLAAVRKFAFSFAIVADVNADGYTRRWCYKDRMETQCALEDWEDYDGRPVGWHREVHTGERREEETGELKGYW